MDEIEPGPRPMPDPESSQPSRQPLSRTVIFDAAIRIAEADGVSALSMRRLGAALGVQAMSLYHHVASKRDLLDGVAGHLLAQMTMPDPEDRDWQACSRVISRSYRKLGHDHPDLFPYVIERPLAAPESLPPLEAVLGVFRHAGFDVQTSYYAFGTFASYVAGFTLDEIAERGQGPTGRSGDHVPELGEVPEEYRIVHEVLGAVSLDQDAAFEFGLDLILAGLEQHLRPKD
jgi:AcrR family transcriptional regulator